MSNQQATNMLMAALADGRIQPDEANVMAAGLADGTMGPALIMLQLGQRKPASKKRKRKSRSGNAWAEKATRSVALGWGAALGYYSAARGSTAAQAAQALSHLQTVSDSMRKQRKEWAETVGANYSISYIRLGVDAVISDVSDGSGNNAAIQALVGILQKVPQGVAFGVAKGGILGGFPGPSGKYPSVTVFLKLKASDAHALIAAEVGLSALKQVLATPAPFGKTSSDTVQDVIGAVYVTDPGLAADVQADLITYGSL